MHRRRFLISTATAATAVALPALAGGHGRLGAFTGVNGHTTSGRAEIAGSTVNLLADFIFDGAPDPKVALGRDGTYDPATLMGALQSNTGASSYTAPAGIDTASYNEVWIWCEQYDVGLAVAPIG